MNGVILPSEVLENQNITSSTGTILVQNCQRVGKIVVFNCFITLPTISAGTTILNFPWKTKGRYDFMTALSNGNKAFYLSIADNTTALIANTGAGSMEAGSYIITGEYVTND